MKLVAFLQLMQGHNLLSNFIDIRNTLFGVVHINVLNDHNMIKRLYVLHVVNDSLHALGLYFLAEKG